MKLNIYKDKEVTLIIDDVNKSIEQGGIFASCYTKARSAVETFVRVSKDIRTNLQYKKGDYSEINGILYRSPQNIIAFSGGRGAGKTCAMLSFADYLQHESSDKGGHLFPNGSAVVLEPIDPTMLAGGQNFLSVVLARLIYEAEEQWNKNTSFHQIYQNKEKEKNEILKKSNSCMNAIDAIKGKPKIDSLSNLQRMSDSAVLKKDFYELIEMIGSFCRPETKDNYVVIPIDDTDCQIQKAHGVMEDIRRYLTLPNVLILMATDLGMLRKVLEQHYSEEFGIGLAREIVKQDEMLHYAEKYMTKLIPATNKIYLPAFDKLLRDSDLRIELGYFENQDSNEDIIDKIIGNNSNCGNGINANFQAKVLSYIYAQTGIVFLEHNNYVHNIIPTTMRGLTHFLNMLASMKPVERIDFNTIESPDNNYMKKLHQQIEALQYNLGVFEEYFLEEWITSKLSMEMIDILNGIIEQVPANRIAFVISKLKRRYKVLEASWPINQDSYCAFVGDLRTINGLKGGISSGLFYNEQFRDIEDFYNTFAIRTIFTIKNNQYALRVKKRALESESMLQMDYSSSGTDGTFPNIDKISFDSSFDFERYLVPTLKALAPFIKGTQSDIKLQELAKIVLFNYDVQELIYKVERNYTLENASAEELFLNTQKALGSKNCGMLSDLVITESNLDAVQIDGYKLYLEDSEITNGRTELTNEDFDKLRNSINGLLGEIHKPITSNSAVLERVQEVLDYYHSLTDNQEEVPEVLYNEEVKQKFKDLEDNYVLLSSIGLDISEEESREMTKKALLSISELTEILNNAD